MNEHVFETQFHKRIATYESVLQFVKQRCNFWEHKGSKVQEVMSAYCDWREWPPELATSPLGKQVTEHLEAMGFKRKRHADGVHWTRLVLKGNK